MLAWGKGKGKEMVEPREIGGGMQSGWLTVSLQEKEEAEEEDGERGKMDFHMLYPR